MVHRCTGVGGDGVSFDCGRWHIRKTKKTIVFQKMVGAFYGPTFDRLVCRLDNRCRHTVKDWGDDEYTLYYHRNGVPLYFEPTK